MMSCRADRTLTAAVARAMDPPPEPSNCHVNTFRAQTVFLPGEPPAPRLTRQPTYVEGWAMLGRLGIWHSWLELEDGRLVDVTPPWRYLHRWARYRAVYRLTAFEVARHRVLPVNPPPLGRRQSRDPRFRWFWTV